MRVCLEYSSSLAFIIYAHILFLTNASKPSLNITECPQMRLKNVSGYTSMPIHTTAGRTNFMDTKQVSDSRCSSEVFPSDGRQDGVDEVEQHGHEGENHSSDVNLVGFCYAYRWFFQEGDVSQSHSSTEVEECCQAMISKVSSSPAGAVLMTSSSKDDHPQEGHDETEDRDKHHPAQRVGWEHVGRGNQDPHQTTKHQFRQVK